MSSSRQIAISARELVKTYDLRSCTYDTIQDKVRLWPFRLPKALSSLDQASDSSVSRPSSLVKPLDGVSFDIYRGESVALLGRNGAGKSTLIKILARITPPTSGIVDIYGQVSALLEVGAGFHGELTGKENVFLNGALLGMRQQEIEENLSAITAFAEIGRYLDVPVKHYSRGMHLRLAFAVAAHLKPEILLLDEVFAVGDVAFQEKCLRKIATIKQEGKTVLFVSHSLELVKSLADRVLLLENGKITSEGSPAMVCDRYLKGFSPTPQALRNRDSGIYLTP